MMKTIFYNILILFTLFNVFYWSLPVIDFFHTIRSNEAGAVYRSFIEWRSPIMHTTLSTVEGPYLQRRTIADHATSNRRVYFFGGSAMWGIGSDDAGTIPSRFAARTGTKPENFAELGWTAHQSLIMLVQLLQEGHRPDLVVFFDGANDVAAKCPIAHGPTSHGKESDFASRLVGADRPQSFSYYLRGVLRLAERINIQIRRASGESPYDCTTNQEKAAAIAANLLRDWQFAKQLVELYGGRFLGVLQPVAYLSQTDLEGLKLEANLGAQFKAVYPMIRKTMASDPSLHDLTGVLDANGKSYLDFVHLNSTGNERIAEEIAKLSNLR